LVREGDLVSGKLSEAQSQTLSAENIPLKVVFEDEDLIVIDKSRGMVVHPGAGNRSGTLVNALLGKGGELSNLSGAFRPGIVHRLDKDTSGLLVVAKNNHAHRFLQDQIQARTFSKIYTALVRGKVEFDQGRIDKPLGRHPKIRQKMAIVPGGRDAQTHYRVLERFRYSTLLEVKIVTGRTHQIRVHLAWLGNPIVGDPWYGTKVSGACLCLHASKLEFVHPKTGKIVKFESPIPEDFRKMIQEARDQ
jgi:23S rRNA pseudouridine1911/1915/1917 synthase